MFITTGPKTRNLLRATPTGFPQGVLDVTYLNMKNSSGESTGRTNQTKLFFWFGELYF